MNVSGLSAIVDFIKLILLLCSGCGYVWMRAKTFSRSPLGCLYREADKRQKCHVLPADFSTGHGEDGGVASRGLVSHSTLDAHTHQPTPHTFFSVTNSILQEKFLVLCPLYASRTESYSNRRR